MQVNGTGKCCTVYSLINPNIIDIFFCFANDTAKTMRCPGFCLCVCVVVLRPNHQLWSWQDGQFT